MLDVRKFRLKEWMREHDITNRAVAQRIGVTEATASILLNGDDMPSKRHSELLELGFPLELLPEPLDKKPGRKKLKARFPVVSENHKLDQ